MADAVVPVEVEKTLRFVMRSAWGQAIERKANVFADVSNLVSGVVDAGG